MEVWKNAEKMSVLAFLVTNTCMLPPEHLFLNAGGVGYLDSTGWGKRASADFHEPDRELAILKV